MSIYNVDRALESDELIKQEIARQKKKELAGLETFQTVLFVLSDEEAHAERDAFEHYRLLMQQAFASHEEEMCPYIAPLCLKKASQRSKTPIADILRGRQYSLVISSSFPSALRVAEEMSAFDLSVKHLSIGIEKEDFSRLKSTIKSSYPDQKVRGICNTINSYEHLAASILSIKKNIKKITFLCDSECEKKSYNLDQSGARKRLSDIFKKAGVRIQYIPLTLTKQISRNTRNKLATSQVALLLSEPAPNKHVRPLGQFCGERGITLVPLHLRSVLEGGSIGMGVSGADYARHLTWATYQLFIEKVPFESFKDIFFEESHQVMFNPYLIKSQNKDLSGDILNALHIQSIITDEAVRDRDAHQFLKRFIRRKESQKQPLPPELASSQKKKKSPPPKRSLEETIEELKSDGIKLESKE